MLAELRSVVPGAPSKTQLKNESEECTSHQMALLRKRGSSASAMKLLRIESLMERTCEERRSGETWLILEFTTHRNCTIK
jgi:hypothetical protein